MALSAKSQKGLNAIQLAELYDEFQYELLSGTPVTELVVKLRSVLRDKNILKVLNEVHTQMDTGRSLGTALQKAIGRRESMVAELVDSAKNAASLADTFAVLQKIAEREADKLSWSPRLISHSSKVLVALSLSILIILSIYVIPSFAMVYTGFGVQLPSLTLFVIGMSETVQSFWLIGLCGIASLLGAYYWLPSFRRWFDRLKLKVPLFGKHRRDILGNEILAIALYLKPLPLPKETIFRMMTDSVHNEYVRALLKNASNSEEYFKQLSQLSLLSPRAERLIERDPALSDERKLLQQYIDRRTNQLAEKNMENSIFIGSAVKAVIFSIVGVLLIAMYLPIFQFGSVV